MKFEVNLVVQTVRDIMGRYATQLTPIEKSQYVASIVGGAIGASLDMPSSPVDIPRNYFLITHSERVEAILGQINEVLPINIDLAKSLADNMFLTRYRIVFEPAYAVHVLGHLAGASDDVFPTTITDILHKVESDNKDSDLSVVTRVLCNVLQNV